MTNIENVISIIDSAAVIDGGKGVIKDSNKDMYNGLLSTLPEEGTHWNDYNEDTRRAWEDSLRPGEIAWAEKEYPDEESRKGKIHERGPKKGTWKLSRQPVGVLPNAYTSAKSVIGNAIANGISPRGTSKSALARATKERTVLTAEEQYTKIINLLSTYLNSLPHEDVKDVVEDLTKFIVSFVRF